MIRPARALVPPTHFGFGKPRRLVVALRSHDLFWNNNKKKLPPRRVGTSASGVNSSGLNLFLLFRYAGSSCFSWPRWTIKTMIYNSVNRTVISYLAGCPPPVAGRIPTVCARPALGRSNAERRFAATVLFRLFSFIPVKTTAGKTFRTIRPTRRNPIPTKENRLNTLKKKKRTN